MSSGFVRRMFPQFHRCNFRRNRTSDKSISQETQHGSQLYRGPHEVWNMGRGSWQIKNVDHWGSRRFSMVWIKTQRPWKPSQYMSISAIIRRSYWFILIKYRRPQLWSIFGYPMSHRIRSQVVGRPLSAKGARVDTRGLGHLGAKDWKVSIFPMQMLWMSFNFLHSFLDLEQQGWTHANLFHSISSQKFGLLGICQSEVWNCEFANVLRELDLGICFNMIIFDILSLSWKATEISSFSMSLDFFCHFSASLWSSVAVCTDFASSTQGRYFAQRRHSHGTQIRFVRLPHPCERWSFFQHEQNPRWLLALGNVQLDLRRKQSNIWLQQCFRKSSFCVPGQVDVRDNY